MSVIFFDDFETGDGSKWTESFSGMTVNMASALEGTYGVEASAGDSGEANKTFNATTVAGVCRLAFRWDFNDLTLSAAEEIPQAISFLGNPSGDILDVDILENSGNTFVFKLYDDSDVAHSVTTGVISSNNDTWEIVITRATNDTSNDGSFEVFKNGVSVGSQSGIDNYDRYGQISSCQLLLTFFGLGGSSGSAYFDDIVFRDDNTPIFGGGNTGAYVIGASLDMENDGSILWVTCWKGDGNMYAQQWDATNMTLNFEIPLGAATLDQIQAKTKIAYPYQGSQDRVWIFGRMSNPAYLTSGTVHLIGSDSGGESGTWSLVAGPYGNFADADVIDSLHVTPDLSGLDDRYFTAVRRRSSFAPELWRGLNGLSSISTIPFPTGTGVEWRGMHINRQYEVSMGSNTLGTGSNRVLSAASPWTTWRDITGMAGPTPFPSGTTRVLRYF